MCPGSKNKLAALLVKRKVGHVKVAGACVDNGDHKINIAIVAQTHIRAWMFVFNTADPAETTQKAVTVRIIIVRVTLSASEEREEFKVIWHSL